MCGVTLVHVPRQANLKLGLNQAGAASIKTDFHFHRSRLQTILPIYNGTNFLSYPSTPRAYSRSAKIKNKKITDGAELSRAARSRFRGECSWIVQRPR